MADHAVDVLVIGAGPAGYVCAIRAAQLGFSVACAEKYELGGTCLNVGCIPSKALLHSSHLYHQAKAEMGGHGISVSGVDIDVPAMMGRKQKLVGELTGGIGYLFKKNKITHLKGAAQLLGGGKVSVGDTDMVTAKHIILATGSEVMPLPGIEIDEQTIVSSTGALALESVPPRMAVIGGGYIGLEMASVWSRLGSQVTVIEYFDAIVPAMDRELGSALKKTLEDQGISFMLGTKVAGVNKGLAGLTLNLESAADGSASTLDADVVLVSIGRRPHTDGLGLDAAGVSLDERGRIIIDDHYQTTAPGVYAIGDVVAGPMLAHKGEEEGVTLAEMLAGQKPHMNYDLIPGIVYTHPEVATVGKSEEQLKEAGINYGVGKFPFMANSRAKAVGDSGGFVKILTDKETDEILGAHIIGPEAGNMIHEIIVGMEYKASAEDIARTCHAHPTFNEAVKEAALAAGGRAIHI